MIAYTRPIVRVHVRVRTLLLSEAVTDSMSHVRVRRTLNLKILGLRWIQMIDNGLNKVINKFTKGTIIVPQTI